MFKHNRNTLFNSVNSIANTLRFQLNNIQLNPMTPINWMIANTQHRVALDFSFSNLCRFAHISNNNVGHIISFVYSFKYAIEIN